MRCGLRLGSALSRSLAVRASHLVGRDYSKRMPMYRMNTRYLSIDGKDADGRAPSDPPSPPSEMAESAASTEPTIDRSQNNPSLPEDGSSDKPPSNSSSSGGSSSEPVHDKLHGQTEEGCHANKEHLFAQSTHVVESIGSAVNATKQQAVNYTHEINRAYAEVEHNMMKRINEGNQQRFRLVLLGSVLFIVWVVSVFGEKIRKILSDQTAGLAKETLENESLKVQTQELAMAVVQTILNDKEVTAHAASFLREASVVPETQQALLELTLHVLQHPDSLREFSVLVKKLIEVIVNDKETVRQVAGLLTEVLEDPKLKAALVKLVAMLVVDPQVVKMASELTVKLLAEKEVIEATNQLLMTSTQTVLADDEVISQSKNFVTDVMGDDALQREGGDAIWNSVTHALKPGVIRIIGFTLVVVSIAVGKVLLSPF